MYRDRPIRDFILYEGIIFIILGALGIALPWLYALSIAILVGWLFVVAGILRGIAAFTATSAKNFFIAFLGAIIMAGIGIWLIGEPKIGVIAMTIILSAVFLIYGLLAIGQAWSGKSEKHWVWLVGSGIVSIACAAVIWVGWPQTASWFIGLLVGIHLLIYGIARVATARKLPKSED